MLYIVDHYNEKRLDPLQWRVGDAPRTIVGSRHQTLEFIADSEELTFLLSALRITRMWPLGMEVPPTEAVLSVGDSRGPSGLPRRLATKAKRMRVSFVLTLEPDDIDLTPRQVEKAVNGILSALAGLNLVYDVEPCQVNDAGPFTP